MSAGTFAGLAVAATAAVNATAAKAAPSERQGSQGSGLEAFDEVYQGRRIQGAPTRGAGSHGGHGGGHGSGHGGGHGGQAHDFGYAVHLDGDELHIMRNADGTWISVVNHYETFATPRQLARAAVTELHGADLVPLVLTSA